MRNEIYIWLIIIISVFVLSEKAQSYVDAKEFNVKSIVQERKILSTLSAEMIYLRKINQYPNERISISTSAVDNNSPNFETEVVFRGVEGILYRLSNDTLKIYSLKNPSYPINFNASIVIDVEKVNDWEFHSLKRNNFSNELSFFVSSSPTRPPL